MTVSRFHSLLATALILAACGDDNGADGLPGDRDGDGIADEIDLCPERPGPLPVGCPVLAFDPVVGPSGTMVYVAGTVFTNDSVVRFGHTDARTIFVSNQALIAMVPFMDESSLSPHNTSVVSIQVDGITAIQQFSVTALPDNSQTRGAVLSAAAADARAELDDLRGDLDAALVATGNIAQRPTLISLVSASRVAMTDMQAALTDLSSLSTLLPADALDVLERLLLVPAQTPPGATVCDGGEMDRLLCARVDYAGRVRRSRELQSVLCGFGQIMAARDQNLAATLAQACAVAGYADFLGSFLLVPEVINVDVVGPQAIEVGAEASYTPHVTLNQRAMIDLVLERLISNLVSVAGTVLPTPSIDSWYNAVNGAIYWFFWELQQGAERTGAASAANFVWWSSSPDLVVLSAGRLYLRKQPAFAPIVITVALGPKNQAQHERRRAMLLACSQSQTCRSAAIAVGAQIATLDLGELSCERVASVPELGGGPGLKIHATGTASGPVAASFSAYVTLPSGVFVVANDVSCGGWDGGELDCTRAGGQPELMIFDYPLVCADGADQPCPQLPFSAQINALVSGSDGATLASRSMFVTCFDPN